MSTSNKQENEQGKQQNQDSSAAPPAVQVGHLVLESTNAQHKEQHIPQKAKTSDSPIKDFDPAEFKPETVDQQNNQGQVSAQSSSSQEHPGMMIDPSSSWAHVVQQPDQVSNNTSEQPVQQPLNYKNHWNEIQEHELIVHSSMDRKRQNLEMLREWDIRRAYFLNVHRQLLEKIAQEVEARWESSNAFAQTVLQYMGNKSIQIRQVTQFQGINQQDAPAVQYVHLRQALSFIEKANHEQIEKLTNFNTVLDTEIIQNLLAVDFNDSFNKLTAVRSELSSLRARITELNGLASRKSGKVALVYNTTTPKTGYKKITQKPKDLFKTQLNFLRYAEVQTETQRHLAKVVLNAWQTAKSVDASRVQTISKALVLYGKAFEECHGKGGESEQLMKQLELLKESQAMNVFEIDQILAVEDIRYLQGQLKQEGTSNVGNIQQNRGLRKQQGSLQASGDTKKEEDSVNLAGSQQNEMHGVVVGETQQEVEKKKQDSNNGNSEDGNGNNADKQLEQQQVETDTSCSSGDNKKENQQGQVQEAQKIQSSPNPTSIQCQQQQQPSVNILSFTDLVPFFEDFLIEKFDSRLLILKEFYAQRNISPTVGFQDTHLVITADNYLHCFDDSAAGSSSVSRSTKSFNKPNFSLCLHKAILRRVSIKNFTVELSLQSTGLMNYLAGAAKFLFNFKNSDQIEELAQFINSLN